MAGGSLFRPDNRMLSGFAHDFSLFGGQPDPAVTVARDRAPVTPESRGGDQPADHPATAPDAAMVPLHVVPLQQDADQATVAADVTVSSHHVAGQAAISVAEPNETPAQGASTSPAILAGQAPVIENAPVSDESVATGTTADTQATLIDQQVGEGIIPVLGSLTAANLALTGSAAGHAALSEVGTIVSGVGHLGDALSPGLADTHDLGAGVIDHAASAAGAAIGSLDDVLTHDGIGNLGGTDPAGGITTLVGMVNTVDQFAVSSTAPAHAAEATGSIVDDLIGGSDGSALLGDTGIHLDQGHQTHVDDGADHLLGTL